MAAVLFRRLLSNIDNFAGTVPAQVQDVCKSQLIEAAHKEQDESMRKKKKQVAKERTHERTNERT